MSESHFTRKQGILSIQSNPLDRKKRHNFCYRKKSHPFRLPLMKALEKIENINGLKNQIKIPAS